MRKTIQAFALVLALAASTSAGEMQFGAPTPPPPQTAQEATTDGEVLTPPLVEIVLSLLALF